MAWAPSERRVPVEARIAPLIRSKSAKSSEPDSRDLKHVWREIKWNRNKRAKGQGREEMHRHWTPWGKMWSFTLHKQTDVSSFHRTASLSLRALLYLFTSSRYPLKHAQHQHQHQQHYEIAHLPSLPGFLSEPGAGNLGNNFRDALQVSGRRTLLLLPSAGGCFSASAWRRLCSSKASLAALASIIYMCEGVGGGEDIDG